METLITLVVLLVVFAIIYWIISIIPFPAPLAQGRWILYAVLAIVAIIVLLKLVLGISIP